jgi:hypothetical protein
MGLESWLVVGVTIAIGLILYQLTKDEDIALDKNMADKLRELPEIYGNAQKSIKIATDFDPKFFNDDKVKGVLKKAYDCKVEIKIITEGPIVEDYKDIAEIKRIDKLNQHIMVIDGADVRLEKPHCGHCFGDNKKDIAFILKGFPDLGNKAEQVFDKLWLSTPAL